MKKHYPSNEKEGGYRFGFHRPGNNSQFHLHMHLISLPLKDIKYEKRYSGAGLKKTDEVIRELEEAILKKTEGNEEQKM